MEFAALEVFEELNHNVSDSETNKFLDFGCGIGRWARSIKAVYPKMSVYGYDINKDIINLAKKCNPKITFFQDYETFLKTGNYDYIIAPFVFHENGTDLIKEIHKVLKPRGKLFVIDYNLLNLTPNEFKQKFIEPTELEEIAQIGFRNAYLQHTAKDLKSFQNESSNYFNEICSRSINDKYFIWTGIKK